MEGKTLIRFGLDAYTMGRADLYKNLSEAANEGNIDPASVGKQFVLSSSFTRCLRYMMQNYQDAMALYKNFGYPDLFITFTCNTKWPEITRFLEERRLKPKDRPDIVCRVFKLKLNNMVKYIKKKKTFGEVKAPKTSSVVDIDNIFSVEIPDLVTSPALFRLVSVRMVHGPCGAQNMKFSCMNSGRCTKHYPKEFVEITTVDDEGYPIYWRRNNGHTFKKNGCDINKRYIVSYNKELLLRFNSHINVEWCNQAQTIKYLFEYINKGHDRVTTSIYAVLDKITEYSNCREFSEWILKIGDGDLGRANDSETTIEIQSDFICKTDEGDFVDESVYSVDFLNEIRLSGVPNHVLKLKVGVPIMLHRNIDQSARLCNGTRLIVTRLGSYVIEAKIIFGSNIGCRVFILRVILTPLDTRLPFKSQRRKFLVVVCFAMTINKSQGQSLSQVDLFLPKPVFTHSQLYVTVSRVSSRKGLKTLLGDRQGCPPNMTTNVLYKKVFSNVTQGISKLKTFFVYWVHS
ncbi:hypothetical protein V2J09_017871 [Rumex salicifolius]